MPTLVETVRAAVVIDFETYPIARRPDYPPQAVGVAIREGGVSRYLAWGHPRGGNTHTLDEARAELSCIVESDRPLLFHNARFDLDVLELGLGVVVRDTTRVHDTMPMLFILDPRAETYSLKPSSERYLDLPPEEQDELIEWLITHQPVEGVKLSAAKKSDHYAGAYVAWAPVPLVDRYARGDVDRTYALAEYAAKRLEDLGAVEAYAREMALLPTLRDMEREGVRVDLERMQRDYETITGARDRVDAWLRAKIGDVNLNSSPQISKALLVAGLARESDFARTKTGKLSTSKASLAAAVKDIHIRGLLEWRAHANTTIETFVGPWIEIAARSGGHIFTEWQSTRTDDNGARTGRMSSTPNFQNIPNPFKINFGGPAPIDLPDLPELRRYILPDSDDHVLYGRDFSAQEPRVFAHYEDGPLAEAYRADPRTDMHKIVADRLAAAGFPVDRQKGKQVNLATMYGMGTRHFAEVIGSTVDEARALRDAYFRLFPSIKGLMRATSNRWKSGAPIYTWGRRPYWCEAPRLDESGYEVQTFEYKALNTLIQGSSADLTKQSVVDYARSSSTGARIRLLVHDEIVVAAPRETWQTTAMELRDAMNASRLDVPMMSEGYVGPNWADLEDTED